MSTHPAVITAATRASLEIYQVPTVPPSEGEVRVQVEWTASTPLDLHQADGGLLVKHPQVLGDGIAGLLSKSVKASSVSRSTTKVFGFTWRSQQEKAHQTYTTAPENLFARLPRRRHYAGGCDIA